MCLIAWNWQPHSKSLLLLANRDEFYARAARPLHWWPGGQVLAGQDLQAGGTWLGVSRSGRLAALTNYRLPLNDPAAKPSRGGLVAGFLQGTMDAPAYLAALAQQAERYNPFNLLLFDGSHLMGLQSRNRRVVALEPGMGAVSNADFDTPWPKLLYLKTALQAQIQSGCTDVPELLALLQDSREADAAQLPQTGVPLELERRLSATWIRAPGYGTRASSVIALTPAQVSFFEQGYAAQGSLAATQHVFHPSCL
jgi:uncharacterized protein with NRDE domain